MPVSGQAARLAETLRLRYQPIVRLEDGKLSHVEVLARVLSQDGQILGPESLVAAMANPELALSLTRAIMHRALSEYQAQGLSAHQLPMAFNLPLNVLVHPGVVHGIETLRETHSLTADLLRFELTETQPVYDIRLAEESIKALRDAGYKLALDDIVPATPFLPALMKSAVGAVKLDRSVVVDATPDARNFILRITRLAASRLQDIIAEGIETVPQLARIRELGVTHGQGYLFSRPLVAENLAIWLSRN
ncbi:MAG: EAL domain-containing protein [Rhodospirillales bacterium]|nr:EAL domain-containing protein [Rhodospirillales bacterium]MDE2390768.1 EAL domain-containing protein [Rhodospirillales bacterium]